ncbi:MAG: pyridoxal-phosphate dependent enzyme [Deinococcales bacterium]
MSPTDPSEWSVDRVAAELRTLSPAYAPTPLLDLPRLAARLGVAQVLVKDEGRRALGSFKSLGGTYAGLRALARATGEDIAAIVSQRRTNLPTLICASDGNHGLAVAEAARLAGGPARIYLHGGVPQERAERIAALGAEVMRVAGTYDDAVAAAADAARSGSGVLVPDTSDDPADPVVRDVMAGYAVMAAEIRRQVQAAGHRAPTHLFVQAGVGGLAAAMADELGDWLAAPGILVVVEPAAARCVGAALDAGRPIQLDGDLLTAAAMLSCGRASAAALVVLLRRGARAVSVGEGVLREAPRLLLETDGPPSTPSGAAGLAGVRAVCARGGQAAALQLGDDSRLLVVVTEGAAR